MEFCLCTVCRRCLCSGFPVLIYVALTFQIVFLWLAVFIVTQWFGLGLCEAPRAHAGLCLCRAPPVCGGDPARLPVPCSLLCGVRTVCSAPARPRLGWGVLSGSLPSPTHRLSLLHRLFLPACQSSGQAQGSVERFLKIPLLAVFQLCRF